MLKIAFEGLDLTGKTTIINEVKEKLEENFLKTVVLSLPSNSDQVLVRACKKGFRLKDQQVIVSLLNNYNSISRVINELKDDIDVLLIDRCYISSLVYDIKFDLRDDIYLSKLVDACKCLADIAKVDKSSFDFDIMFHIWASDQVRASRLERRYSNQTSSKEEGYRKMLDINSIDLGDAYNERYSYAYSKYRSIALDDNSTCGYYTITNNGYTESDLVTIVDQVYDIIMQRTVEE